MHGVTLVPSEGGRRVSGQSRSHIPLVSIITVVFRAEQELEEILENVFQHDPVHFELIVIDGNSGQPTIEILSRWSSQIDYWLSEPDGGLYEAMNKGLALAQGEFVYHLNAGDRLIYFPVPELIEVRNSKIDVATFSVRVEGQPDFRPTCGPLLRFKNTLHHQGTFYRRQVFHPYDLQYRALADFDSNQRLALRGIRMRAFSSTVAYHATGGIGNSAAGDERFRIVRKNFGLQYVIGSWLLSEWGGIKVRNIRRLKRLFQLA